MIAPTSLRSEGKLPCMASSMSNPMPFDRRAEVERLLDDDETLLGRLWAYDKQDLSPERIGELEGTPTFGWVYNYRSLSGVLRDGEIPQGPTLARQAAHKVRAWLKKLDLSEELRAALTEQESLLMSRAEDREAQTEEVETAVEATKSAEAAGTPGIYVYTLPHYLKHPFHPRLRTNLAKGRALQRRCSLPRGFTRPAHSSARGSHPLAYLPGRRVGAG